MSFPIRVCAAFASMLLGAAVISASGFAQTYEPPPAKEGYSYATPYCTNRGQRVELDEVSCLKVDGKAFLARCSMSVNSPTWRKVQDGCPAEATAGQSK